MSSLFKLGSKKIKTLFSEGFFYIFGANILNKVVAFIANIIIVRFLTQDEYGIFSYANNIYSIALLFSGVGLLSGMFQFCAEKRSLEEKREIGWFVLSRGAAVDVGICILLGLAGFMIVLPIPEAGQYIAQLAPLVLIDYLFQYAVIYFRARKMNRDFSALQTLNTVVYLFAACAGACWGGISGTILGRYFAYIVTIVYAAFLLKKDGFFPLVRKRLARSVERELWAYSLPTQFSSCLNQLTLLLDVFLVGLLLANESDVALYTVATLIPEGMMFVPASLNMFVAPYFVEHNRDRGWYECQFKRYFAISAVAYLLIFLLLFLLAPWIVTLLWGNNYAQSIVPFRILSFCFVFTGLRAMFTNLLCTIRAVKSNLVVSILSLIVNVVLCFVLIPLFGITGAAWAPTVVSIVAAFVSCAFLVKGIAKLPLHEGRGDERVGC